MKPMTSELAASHQVILILSSVRQPCILVFSGPAKEPRNMYIVEHMYMDEPSFLPYVRTY